MYPTIEQIYSEIAAIQASGEIAAPNNWISSFTVTKPSGKRYMYYRLMEATDRHSRTGKVQGKVKRYLGTAQSSKYKQAVAAIARRNRLQLLQRQVEQLEKEAPGDNGSVAGVTVSGGHVSSNKPRLTSRSQRERWQLLEYFINQLQSACQELAIALEQEKQLRLAITEELKQLKQVLGLELINSN